MSQHKTKTIFTLGFALFAMFFGAGNLILPPFIGLKTGDEWYLAMSGFISSGILGPFLGVLVIVLFGGTFIKFGSRISKNLAVITGASIMLCIGPLVAIPRTGATTYEVGILPLLPEASAILCSIIYFAIVFVLSISPSKIVDIIGKFLTPLLLIVLLLLIVAGVVNGAQSFHQEMIDQPSFAYGFIEGYQTLDVLAAVVFASLIIEGAKRKGFVEVKQQRNIVIYSGILSVTCLIVIYGGLMYLGSIATNVNPDISRTELLIHISKSVLGHYGTMVISLAISLACLTTSIALTTSFAEFFRDLFNNKVSYRFLITICIIVSAIFSVLGVDSIIEYAGAILNFVYPIVLVMIIYMLIFGNNITSNKPYLSAVLVTIVISILNLLINFNIIPDILVSFPLRAYGVEWVLPSLLGFGVGMLLTKRAV